MSKKKSVLEELCKEIKGLFVELINFFAVAYEQGSEYILHLFLNVGIIYFLVKVITHFNAGSISQIIISLVLVTHLFMWLCWMLNDILNRKEGLKNDG